MSRPPPPGFMKRSGKDGLPARKGGLLHAGTAPNLQNGPLRLRDTAQREASVAGVERLEPTAGRAWVLRSMPIRRLRSARGAAGRAGLRRLAAGSGPV